LTKAMDGNFTHGSRGSYKRKTMPKSIPTVFKASITRPNIWQRLIAFIWPPIPRRSVPLIGRISPWERLIILDDVENDTDLKKFVTDYWANRNPLTDHLPKHPLMNILDPHKGKFIRTLSGRFVDVQFPQPEMFDIGDIAHGLSHAARWAGQSREFYTVAQHCIEASKKVHPRHALAALLHDAPEYVMGDLSAPIKGLLDYYKHLENKVMAVIAAKYGCTFPFDPEIKKVDIELMEWEYKNLMLEQRHKFFIVMSPAAAKAAYIKRFNELTQGRA
jgi:hypothetical protein